MVMVNEMCVYEVQLNNEISLSPENGRGGEMFTFWGKI